LAFLVGLLIGVAAGLLFAAGSPWRSWFGQAMPAAGSAPDPAAPSQPAPDSAPLGQRLHALESVFASYTSNYAHPRELEDQPQFKETVALLARLEVSSDTVMQYACGTNWGLSCAALAAMKERYDVEHVVDDVTAHFDKLHPWAMYFALEFFLAADPRPAVGAPVAGAKDWWAENVVIPVLLRDYFARRESLGDAASFGAALGASWASPAPIVRAFLQRVTHPYAVRLIAELDHAQGINIDRAFLTTFGRFWADRKEAELLIEPEPWREAMEAAEAASMRTPMRSLLVSGEPRVGKTAFLRLLAKRLEGEGWSVFEAGGADLMAGQQWFGQLEGRIQRTIEELAASKKVIWYIPDILQLARSGTHQGQAASILDQILPAVASGRLIVWTEATATSTARLLQARPTLRGLLELARMEPLSPEETSDLAHALVDRLADAAKVVIDPGCVELALSSARQYMSAANLPGAVLDLIKLTVSRALKSGAEVIEAGEVIVTLAQLTGLPVAILDNKERVDLAAIRAYFSARVIGQDEAVSAIVERIAMLKAGLNDPAKPIGVFLFAGSTGTGKTELAKTAAEYLFGSAERMIRLDMSEFQSAEAAQKILGGSSGADDADALIGRVRKQPFSVVLLDEFEKAHASIWDLFLQVFDDGRLTDSMGHTADFRHCMIILTTNLGAASHQNSGLGFAPAAASFSGDQVMRAIGQTFRPEFQNRLDKVIVFRPLNRDLMREILKKELGRVLERRGLKNREWAVEWEASAQEFLLEKGFSAEMGARPLKRAIDQYVIAPLAETIVEQRFPEGDQFVFVRSDGRAIQAEFVDPDSDGNTPAKTEPTGAAAPPRPVALPAMILAPTGSDAELGALEVEFAGIERTFASAEWEERKAGLSQAMTEAGFWTRPARFETLSRLALIDRLQAAAATAQSLRTRLAKGTERTGKSSRELVGRLALQLHLIKEGLRDMTEAAPIEVALLVEPAFEKAGEGKAARQWCQQLLGMYRAWAGNRRMQLSEVAVGQAKDTPCLIISGFGAHRLLAQEVGLHVLEFADDDDSASRAAARVRLAVTPLGDLPADRLRAALGDAFGRGPQSATVVRRYRREPSPLVRDMIGSWRTGRLDAVLAGNFDLIAASQG